MSRTLGREHLKNICRIGQGEKTCSYLGQDKRGIMCLKGTKYHQDLFQRRMLGQMKTKGDNCTGHPDYIPITEENEVIN